MVIRRAGLLAALIVAGASPASAQQAIMGGWARDDGMVRVRVAPCGNVICMTNVSVKPGASDKVGERVEFKLASGTGDRLKGTMYDPKSGSSYPTTVTVSGQNMTTRGCALGGIVCKTVGWTRTN